jgi:hypothetical protein
VVAVASDVLSILTGVAGPSGMVGNTYTAKAGPASNAAGGGSTSNIARNRPYGDAVSHAAYFYMDRFCVLVSVMQLFHVVV